MVDTIVSYALQKLGDFLIEKTTLQRNIRDDAEWMKTELRYMKSFLKDAEKKQITSHLVQEWLSEITDLARDTVDILDEYTINVENHVALENGLVDRVKSYACICKREADLYGIGHEIASLKKRVLNLSRLLKTYDITKINSIVGEGSKVRERRRTTSYEGEQYFVGFTDVAEMLMKELLKDEEHRSVISIYGMGGLGKTALAQNLYNSTDVQIHFSCRAWVCVSQEYSIQDLLRTVIKSFKMGCHREELEMLEMMNEGDLECYLQAFLNDQRYLVVIDDVWRKEAWESLKRAFPDCRNGSRVIITTRNKEVAERVDDISFVHHLRFLRPEESWDLFTTIISRGEAHPHWFSPALKELGKEIVGKCGGLPLAIIVLGGLLSHKKDPKQWRKVKEQLWQHMKNDSVDISHVLSLSYNDLSSELKQCFLYIGIFPEDYVIRARKLMLLWMAEEFIPQRDIMEDIAEDYLHELIDRSLLQVVDKSWGKIESCKIHDLLRDLVVEKAKKVKFFDIYDPRLYTGLHSGRRHAIHTEIEKFCLVGISSAKLRSLVFFNPNYECLDIRNLKIICEKLKFLRVLELEYVSFGKYFKKPCRLPDAIGDLIHLKFLGLLRTNFSQLPSTIGKLKSLQSLQISSNDAISYRVPDDISKLINLRYLVLRHSKGHLKISTLVNLRTLRGINYDQWITINTINLVNLRELRVFNVAPVIDTTYSLDSISNLKSLTTLTLHSTRNLPPLEPLFSCSCLLSLWLHARLENLAPFSGMPESLTILKLTGSKLVEDPMPTLEKLLNLKSLELEYAYDGKEMRCGNNKFVQLEHLKLCNLSNLENWSLEEMAMPVIRRLNITECPKLKNVPERLKSIMTMRD